MSLFHVSNNFKKTNFEKQKFGLRRLTGTFCCTYHRVGTFFAHDWHWAETFIDKIICPSKPRTPSYPCKMLQFMNDLFIPHSLTKAFKLDNEKLDYLSRRNYDGFGVSLSATWYLSAILGLKIVDWPHSVISTTNLDCIYCLRDFQLQRFTTFITLILMVLYQMEEIERFCFASEKALNILYRSPLPILKCNIIRI